MKPDTPETHARKTATSTSDAGRNTFVLASYFFITGALLPVWASRIPAVTAQSDVGADQLGLALLFMGIAAAVTARVGGTVLDKVEPRHAIAPTAAVASAALVLPGTATGPGQLTAALVVLGIAQSFLNVCVNTQAAHLQRSMGRSMLSTFHAFVSIGGCAGALAGVASTQLRMEPLPTFQVAALVLGAIALAGAHRLVRHLPRREPSRPGPERPRFRMNISPAILLLGGLALAGVLSEAAVQDWSALFAQETVGAGETLAASVFAAFTVAMACGRLAGDRLTLLLGRTLLVRSCALTAFAGFALALSVPLPAATLAGFALVGLGLSCVVPQILSAAADLDPDRVGRNMGTVASIGYVGPLIGSPVIGTLAAQAGVGTGLLLPAALTLVIALAAGLLRTGRRQPVRV